MALCSELIRVGPLDTGSRPSVVDALINSLKIASPNPSKIFVAALANSNSNYFVHIFLIIGVA